MAMRRGVSIAGTHGKTTTSSMVSHVLHCCGLDPTYVIGGELNDMGSNAGAGQGEWLVAETDESDGSLLYLRPEVAAVLNLEMDHHANYKTLDEIRDVFRRFVALLPEHGRLVLVEGEDTAFLRAETTARGRDRRHRRRRLAGRGRRHVDAVSAEFVVRRGGEELGEVRLKVGGEHNVIDALACLACVDHCGVAVRRRGALPRRASAAPRGASTRSAGRAACSSTTTTRTTRPRSRRRSSRRSWATTSG